MSKISCDVIKDIIPLCLEEVASEDTKVLVEEHVLHCKDCKKEYEMMKQELIVPNNQGVNFDEKKVLKSFQKFLRKRKLITMIVSALVTFGVIFGVQVLLMLPRLYIPYDAEYITIEVDNKDVYVACDLTYFNGVVSHNMIEVELNGEKENVVMVYYYYSLWSRYIEPFFRSTDELAYNNRTYVGTMEELTQIYYGEFNKQDNFNENFPATLNNLDLIWRSELE